MRVHHTIIAKEAQGLLWLDRNESSNEVVENGCYEDNKQEDLGLHESKFTNTLVTNVWIIYSLCPESDRVFFLSLFKI